MVGLIGLLLSSPLCTIFIAVHRGIVPPSVEQDRPPLPRSRSVDGQGWSDAKDGRIGAEERASVLRDPPNDRFCLLSLGAHVKKGRAEKVFRLLAFSRGKSAPPCAIFLSVSLLPRSGAFVP